MPANSSKDDLGLIDNKTRKYIPIEEQHSLKEEEEQDSVSQQQSFTTEKVIINKELGEIAESEEVIESSKLSQPKPSISQ